MRKRRKRKRHISTRSVVLSRRKRRAKKIIGIIFASAVIFVALVFGTRHEKLSIYVIDVKGGVLITKPQVMETLDVWLEQEIFGIIPYSNRFYATPKRIRSRLVEEYGSLEDVEIETSLEGGMLITLKELDLKLLGCRDSSSRDSERCVMVSKTGEAVATAPYYSNGLITKIYAPDTFFEEFYPFSFLQQEHALGIIAMFDELKEIGFDSTVGTLLNDRDMVFSVTDYKEKKADIDIYIELKDTESEIIRQRLLENLTLGIEGSPLGGLLSKNAKSIEKIDLRFEDQVTYKAR